MRSRVEEFGLAAICDGTVRMTTATDDSAVCAAVMYARDGVHVFPIDPATKRPLVKDWPSVATTDEARIKVWWTKWPRAMIGAGTGARSGFWALDLDRKPDRDGVVSLAALEATHGALPATFRARTPGGGEHLYFRFPRGTEVSNRASDIAPGIDTRGGHADGSSTGYVVLPPSVREDGKCYQPIDASDLVWSIGEQLPDAPTWLLFLAMFGRRQREQLATIGIAGPSAFEGATPSEWPRLADNALARAWGTSRTSTHRVPDGSEDKVLSYIDSAIQRELDAIPDAESGEQERTINNAGLQIHSLIKGARLCGADADALGAIEASAHSEYVISVQGMQAFKSREPWSRRDAETKWRRTREDAEPRNLSHVIAHHSDADADFGDVVLDSPSPIKGRVLWVEDQPLQSGVSWLVDEAIPQGGIGFLVAKPSMGKTFLAVDLALSVGYGVPFFGRAIPERGGVHIIAAEGGYSIPQRARAAVTNKFAKLDLPAGVDAERFPISYEKGAPDLLTPKGLKAFMVELSAAAAAMVERYAVPLRLVIIDTFGQAFTLEDENASANVAKATQAMQKIADKFSVAVMAVHHFGKNTDSGPRGSSALQGNADFILSVKTPGALTLDKSRDGPEGALGQFILQTVNVGRKPNGEPLTSQYVVQQDEWSDLTGAPASPAQQIFDESYRAAFGGKGELRQLPSVARRVRMVMLQDVRAEFYERKGGTSDANRQAFKRALDSLPDKYRRDEWEGCQWIWEADI